MRSYVFLADLAAKVDDKQLDPNDVKPGWVALGIVVLLCIAVAILARSFLKHSRKALQTWDDEDADPGVKRTTPHDRS